MQPTIGDVRHAPTPAARELLVRVHAGDWPGAARVVEDHWVEIWFAVDPADLRRVLGAAPVDALRAMPNARFLAGMTGQPPAPASGPDAPGAAPTDLSGVLRTVADLRLNGRPVRALDVAASAMPRVAGLRGRLVDTSGGLAGLMHVHAGSTALLAGDLTTAIGWLHRATTTREPDRFPFVPRDAAAKLALAHTVAGHVREACVWADRAHAIEPTSSWVESLIDDTLWIVDYVCAVETLDLDRAERMRQERPSPVDHLEFWGPALQAHVRHLVLTGRRSQATALCDEVAAAGLPLEGSDGWVATMLAEARLTAADGVAVSTPLAAGDTHLALHACLQWFRTGQFDRVVERNADATGSADTRPGLALEILRAQSLLRLGRTEEGTAALGRVLEEVLDRSALSLLRFLTAKDLATVAGTEAGAEAARLVTRHDVRLTEVVAVLRAPLTPAELDVLRLLRGGRTRQEIANELFLSLSTVKTHLNSAYRKLGVTGRAAALAMLERLGI